MRFELIIEDTLRGVTTSVSGTMNGVTDNGQVSLSAHLLAQWEQHLGSLGRIKSLVIEEGKE